MDAPAKEVVEVYRNMLLESRGELTDEQSARRDSLVDNLRDDKKIFNEEKFSAESLERGKEIFLKNATYQRGGDGRAVFENIQLLNLDGELINEVIFGQKVILRMVVRFKKDVAFLGMGYHIRNATGIDLVYTDSRFNDTKAIFDAKAGGRSLRYRLAIQS